MENGLAKSLAFTVSMMMLLSVAAFSPVEAWPGSNNIYLDPDYSRFNTTTTSPCHKFQATLYAENLPTPVWAWQVRLNIVPADDWINITGAWLVPSDPKYIFAGQPTAQPSPALTDSNSDGNIDSVLVGDTILVGAAVSGYGPFKLAVLEFHLTKAPGKYQPPLSVDLDIDNDQTYLLDEALAEISPIIKNNGAVTYSWSPPATNPHMAIVPANLLFDELTDWTDPANSDFTVDVYIEDLETGWMLHNASFDLLYDSALLDTVGVVVDPAWAGPNSVSVVPGVISVFVQGHPAPAGDVLVATITFRIIYQGVNPPQPKTEPNATDLAFDNVVLWDTVDTIPLDPPENGRVTIEPNLGETGMPWLEVSSCTLGPELVICEQYGQEFEVNVSIKNLYKAWRLVGVELRLCYDPETLEVLDVIEGPFLQDPTWNWYGTYPITTYPEPANPHCPSWHIVLGDFLLPNASGYWDQPFPEGEGTLFTIRFKPLQQSWIETLYVNLTIYPLFPDEYGVDREGNVIPFLESEFVHGNVIILPIEPVGRRIDVWFVNPPNGGHCFHQPADLVLPQTEVTLTAKVTYNWWPVQYKKVTFEVRDNHGALWAILQDDTNEDGHAYVTFRMPWISEDAEALLGKWRITVSVTLADVVITDYVIFDYDYLIRIWNVATDKAEYRHCEDIQITVDFGTHAMREESVVLAVTIMDEPGVPVASTLVELIVGGAEFCHYKNYTATVNLHIDKFAYAGQASVHVSFLDALPSEDGEAVAQEVTETFYILPC